MCGRYGFTSEIEEVKTRFDIERWLGHIYEKEQHFNIGPGTRNPVVVRRSPNSVAIMKWGWSPEWSRKSGRPLFIFNARTDKLESSVMYKKPFAMQRCIVPANYFIEWDHVGKAKIPYLFKVKDEEIFGFAGIYFIETDAEEHKQEYYVIITTEPNELLEPIHNRMPVILDKDDEEDWLNPDIVEPERLLPLLKQYPANKMISFEVSDKINSTRNDSGDVIQPINSK